MLFHVHVVHVAYCSWATFTFYLSTVSLIALRMPSKHVQNFPSASCNTQWHSCLFPGSSSCSGDAPSYLVTSFLIPLWERCIRQQASTVKGQFYQSMASLRILSNGEFPLVPLPAHCSREHFCSCCLTDLCDSFHGTYTQEQNCWVMG